MRSSAVVGIVGLIVMCVLAVNAYSQPRVALRDFMRAKLRFSQQALEGLVMDDLASVQKAAQEMKLLSLEETWQVLQTPEYVEFSRKFRTEAEALSAAAGKNQLENSTAAFNRLTTRCVECHKYVRGVRVAKAAD
jgi:cytochrome c556